MSTLLISTRYSLNSARAFEACWDEDRFIRGYRENGEIVGAKKDPEASMWLNPQSWSVISGFASDKQAETAMEKVHEILNTPFGVKIMEPPYVDHYFDGALMHIFNPDTKENGGIFSQTQGWAILAESLLGHGDRAFEYFLESSPANMNDKAEVRILRAIRSRSVYRVNTFTICRTFTFIG